MRIGLNLLYLLPDVVVGWQDDPYAALGAADVLVHTSIEPDSLPTVILEAMAMARPVIAANVGGVPELVVDDKTGLLTSAGNLPDLVAALRFCNEHRESCIEMGLKGQERLWRHFTLRQKVQQILDAYASCE
jgi:glycosyltransferase involved in cell wall biosynthesis